MTFLPPDLWDGLRVLHIVLAALTVVGMGLQWRWWRDQEYAARLLLLALLLATLVSGLGSVELLRAGVAPGGYRTLGVTVFLSYTVVGVGTLTVQRVRRYARLRAARRR